MQKHLLSIFCCSALVVIVTRALPAADSKAADAKPPASSDAAGLFDRLDANHDGQLTADEIPAEKKGLFDRLLRLAGKPTDGKLSRDEFIAQLNAATEDHPNGAGAPSDKPSGPTPPEGKPAAVKSAGVAPAAGSPGNRPLLDPERIFDRLDTKHTGKITAADIPEERPMLKRLFAEAGKAEGGSLTREEFVKLFKAMLAKRGAGNSQAAKPAADGKPSTEVPANADRIVDRLLKLSKRSDGKLTKDDLPERLRDRFDKIDANHDGLIDETELRGWLATVKSRLSAPQGK